MGGWPAKLGLRHVAAAALVLGVALRVVPYLLAPGAPLGTCDGLAYWHMAENLAAGNGLSITSAEVAEEKCSLPYGPSHHYSPLLPIIEAGFILALGANVGALAAATLTITAATVFVGWWTARDLYGSQAGLVVGAAVALEWTTSLWGSRFGYAENLVLATFLLTLWAILRSLRDPRFIVLAGLFAGLGYLSKGSIGWFFLIAGIGGAAWRLAHHGWRGLANRWYLLAVAVFSTFVVAWSARNLHHFWDGTLADFWYSWPTSESTMHKVQSAVVENPERLATGLAAKLAVLGLLVAVPLLPLANRIRDGLAGWRRETTSALWLASLLVFVLGWFLAAAQWVSENTSLAWADPVRYVAPAAVPLLWVAIEGQEDRPSPLAWLLLYLLSVTLTALMPGLMGTGALLGVS